MHRQGASALRADANLPTIEVDGAKCTAPFECKRCLQVCPHAIFALRPIGAGKFHAATGYTLHAAYRAYCTLCNECVKLCPTGALTIRAGEKQAGSTGGA